MNADLPLPARLLARLVPSIDRESIVGDLIEDAEFRSLRGLPRAFWITGACAAIGAGFSCTRARRALAIGDMHGLVVGLAVDGRRALRPPHLISASLRTLVFCGSVATLSFATALLVSTLLSAAGL
ncbi:MAG TPA: hypothetical protein VGL62_13270 [Vicinamibacterales bacterium]|jgi:hypothetical protein